MSIFPLLQHYVSIYQLLTGSKSSKFDAKFAAKRLKNRKSQKRAAVSLEALLRQGGRTMLLLIAARSCRKYDI
jgi:hypothetical protein